MVEINSNPAVHPEYSFKERKEILLKVEHRLARPSRDYALRATVNFPNLPLKEALQQLSEFYKKNKK